MQNIAGRCQQTFENKKVVDITQQCFAFLPEVNFLPIIEFSLKLNVMGLNPGYLLKSFLLYLCKGIAQFSFRWISLNFWRLMKNIEISIHSWKNKKKSFVLCIGMHFRYTRICCSTKFQRKHPRYLFGNLLTFYWMEHGAQVFLE